MRGVYGDQPIGFATDLLGQTTWRARIDLEFDDPSRPLGFAEFPGDAHGERLAVAWATHTMAQLPTPEPHPDPTLDEPPVYFASVEQGTYHLAPLHDPAIGADRAVYEVAWQRDRTRPNFHVWRHRATQDPAGPAGDPP